MLEGEHTIDSRVPGRSRISNLLYKHSTPASEDAKKAITNADVIVLGPGDLYTSTISALLPAGLKETIQSSKGKLVFIMNLFTKTGQTDGLTAADHIHALQKYTGLKMINPHTYA